MRVCAAPGERVRLDGKFFRVGGERFFMRGLTYGAFGPNAAGEPFPEPRRAEADLDQVVHLGANTLRIYDVPPGWLLEAAAIRGLRLFLTIPWNVQATFLDSRTSRRAIRTAVTSAVQSVADHPAVIAIAVASEIPPDLVRWSTTARVAAFIDEIIGAARQAAPATLFTYANFPPTEFLQPRDVDFVTFNVFLHSQSALAGYLAHVHLLAEGKPLVLGECGVDARREGPARQAEILSWTLATAVDAGLAGAVVFSFTDEWVRDGRRVEDWEMGITTDARDPKPAFEALRLQFLRPGPEPIPGHRVSVVVACYNGESTLRACLESLLRLRYPDYEIIVVDDGSTDQTPAILAEFQQVRTVRVRSNLGLSAARNLGIRAATGAIIAFTDADCRVDPDWLRFLVAGMDEPDVAGAGGPNLLPEDDPPVAAVIMVAPGGPAHVLLEDRTAEHVPGCNMAFWKWALDAIEGFDPIFRSAGDDVDVCWRLQRRGWLLRFAPAAFVWHHRRSSIRGYLRQQAGYGAAEAMLLAKHPTHFNALGGARWKGRISTPTPVDLPWRQSAIFRGLFATGLFQTLYTPATESFLPLLTSLEYLVLVAIPVFILSFHFHWLSVPAAVLILGPPVACVLAARGTTLPRERRRWWSRPLLTSLYLLQPLARGMARYRGRLGLPATAVSQPDSLEAEARVYGGEPVRQRAYWSATWRDRRLWVEHLVAGLERRGWPCHVDAGWGDFDLEVFGRRWSRAVVTTAAEATREGAQILRCRMRPRWTLAAHVAFWGVAAIEFLVVGVFEVDWRGWWISGLTLVLLLAFLYRDGQALLCRLSVILDEAARGWGLVPVDNKAPKRDPPEERGLSN